MAGANDFVRIADGASADVEPIANWVAEAGIRADGFPNGVVDQLQYNRAWRQATTAMALLGAHMAEVLNQDVDDDTTGTIAALWAQFWRTMMGQFAFPDVGVVNALLTANPSGVAFPAPTEGQSRRIKVAVDNTGNATYNDFGTGSVQILNTDGTQLTRGALFAGGYVDLIYTTSFGNAWLMVSSSPGQIRGLSFGTRVDTINVGSGNYIVPANTFIIQPILYGGGGGSCDSDNVNPVAGAGSGACCIGTPIITAPGTAYSYVVGAGGVHNTVIGGTGGNGGTTTFNAGALSAGGGTGSSIATVGFGGSASGGLMNLQGAPGSSYGGASGGIGATSPGSYGSGGGAAGTGIAANGGFPGGGAGGPGSGGVGSPGKDGGNGVIYILR